MAWWAGRSGLLRSMWPSSLQRATRSAIETGRVSARRYRAWPGNALGVVAVEKLPNLDAVARIEEIEINLAKGNRATCVCEMGEAYSIVNS